MSTQESRPWTMKEIARAAGVSTTTVSHTISGKRPVKPETAARIRALIDEHGYVQDASAVRLRSGRNGVIALAVPDIGHPYFGQIAKGAEEAADARQHALVIASTANADPRRQRRYIDMIRNRSVDGLVYTSSRTTSDIGDILQVAEIAPLVLADDALDGSDILSVSSATGDGARQVAEHLAGLGHRNAVVVGGYPGLSTTQVRNAAFAESFPHSLTLSGDFEIASGYQAASSLIANRVPFTCVFAHNDLMALGVIKRLSEEGIHVPQDVSVVGYDDLDVSTVVTPELTTVRKDLIGIGRAATDLLIDQLDGVSNDLTSAVLPTELLIRGTTAPPPA